MRGRGDEVKLFLFKDILTAFEYVAQGGQALHVWNPPRVNGRSVYPEPKVPECFAQAATWGHLIDDDADRLIRTARRLGVRRIVVSRAGKRGQHIDLCRAPLRRAIAEAT